MTINKQAQARFVRLTVESTTGGAWASVWEMEIYVNEDNPKPAAQPTGISEEDETPGEGETPEEGEKLGDTPNAGGGEAGSGESE